MARTTTQNGTKLQGLFAKAQGDTAILYIHGLEGNFYENDFIDVLLKVAQNNSISFLSANTHGAESVKILGNTKNSLGYEQAGAAYELREHIKEDIDAWYKFLQQEGIKHVILAGHSLGTVKVTYYVINHYPDRFILPTLGIVLFAAVDYWYLGAAEPTQRGKHLKEAKKALQNGKCNDFVPETYVDTNYFTYLSYKSYVDWFDFNNGIDIFPFLHPPYNEEYKQLRNLKLPFFIVQGGADTAVKDALKSKEFFETSLPNAKTFIIEGANHWYVGKFAELEKIFHSILKAFQNERKSQRK